MIKLASWRSIALLAVAVSLFLAANAVPKPSAVRTSSADISEAEVRVNVAVPLLRKLAKYNDAWNEYLLYGSVNEHHSTDQAFEHAEDIFDSAFLDSYVERLLDDTTEEGLEEISSVVWSITPQQMQELFEEAVSKLPAHTSRMWTHVASLGTGFTNSSGRAVELGNVESSERQIHVWPYIEHALVELAKAVLEMVHTTPAPMTPQPGPYAPPPDTSPPRTPEPGPYAPPPGTPEPWNPEPWVPEPWVPEPTPWFDDWGNGGGGGGGAGGWGDPHLTGFDDRKFLLTGDAIHEYNLFSADNVALNTRMYVDNDKTFFREFSLIANGDALRVDMDPAQKTVAVTINGVLLDRHDLRDTANMSVETQPVGKINLKVSVATATAIFTFDTRLYKRPHLDFSLELTRDLREEEAGGILGHTLHRGIDVPHPADMADDEIVARYAAGPATARVAGSS